MLEIALRVFLKSRWDSSEDFAVNFGEKIPMVICRELGIHTTIKHFWGKNIVHSVPGTPPTSWQKP